MKKKVIVGVGLSLALVAAVAVLIIQINKPSGPTIRTSVTLAKQDLVSLINVTGSVKSANVSNVYSTLPYPISTVEVEVGDVVSEGDLLCQLDTASLKLDISKLQATINSAAQASNLTLNTTRDQYDLAKANAEAEWSSALAKAEQAFTAAELEVYNTRQDYRNVRNSGGDDAERDKLAAVAERAYYSYEAAQDSLERTKESIELQRKKWEEDYANSIKKAEISSDLQAEYISLQMLNKNLSDSTIKAPVSGTVTAVYAKEGAPVNGLLFVIEDTENLKITTKIKEYDVTSIKPGNRVIIKSDATGKDEYDGMVDTIAPTSLKDVAGNAVDTNDIQFSTDVVLLTKDSPLRIGMNSRLNIVVDERQSVFAIPFEVLKEDADGASVFVAQQQEDGTYVAKKIPVTLGLETDFLVEISAPELTEGIELISDIDGLEDGTPIRLSKDMESSSLAA
ncbi:HlyD family efflux transporter periplasmic adaptor subunit [Oscillospiraceae bacterium MB08-C2-2]|nr:HlyD family efflux transporter periplasmic adaptor subunit [Oscillospiraceae bacterium MB08-C2-2]